MNEKESFFETDRNFSELVKKARRKSLFRNITISVVVCIVLFYGLYALGSFVMQKKIEKDSWIDGAWDYIEGANVEAVSTSYNYTPFSAVGTTQFTKQVGGVPIPWGSEEKEFTMFGTSKRGVSVTTWTTDTVDNQRLPFYFQGQRMIEFFHPGIDYDQLFDERPLLEEIDQNKLVEFAFSFDQPYSLQEVQDVFSDHLAWYWVDTFSRDELGTDEGDAVPITGDEAIGFPHSDVPDADSSSIFMHQLEWLVENGGERRAGAERLYHNITGNDPSNFSPTDLKITGVVVTGSPDELKGYNDIPFIRTAILGATVDKY